MRFSPRGGSDGEMSGLSKSPLAGLARRRSPASTCAAEAIEVESMANIDLVWVVEGNLEMVEFGGEISRHVE